MTKKLKPIMVTGGAGYIGSHICKFLSKSGYEVVVYDNFSTGNRHAVKWGTIEEGDVLDEDNLIRVIKKHDIAAVIHMAAFIAVGESVTNPGKYYKNNTMGGLSVLNAMHKCGLDKIVFSSTAAVYGEPKKMPITEESPTNPINPYGHSKYMMEQILQDYRDAHKIRSVILRYFNVAGADVDCETGCEHKSPNNLIPILMNVASGKKDFAEIYGTDYETKDGTAVRDYIHVCDLARAHILALEYLFAGKDCTIINLGTGNGYSVKEVVNSAKKVTNIDFEVKNSPRRAGDPPILFAGVSKAQDVLGWVAEYKDIDFIIKTAWDWQQKL